MKEIIKNYVEKQSRQEVKRVKLSKEFTYNNLKCSCYTVVLDNKEEYYVFGGDLPINMYAKNDKTHTSFKHDDEAFSMHLGLMHRML